MRNQEWRSWSVRYQSNMKPPRAILTAGSAKGVQVKVFGKSSSTRKPSGPPGAVLYAVGDIHGRLDLLKKLLASIKADIAQVEVERSIILFVGDYIDRGPDSRGVVDEILALRGEGASQVVTLAGNHDQYLLEFFKDPSLGISWMDYGAGPTFTSYGVRPPPVRTDVEAWKVTAGEMAAAMPPEHMRFFEEAILAASFGDFLFVHAGVRPNVDLSKQDPKDLTTIRRPFLKAKHPLPGRVVVFGHTPFEHPVAADGKIAVDTGAYATGVLSAVRIHGHDVSFLQTS